MMRYVMTLALAGISALGACSSPSTDSANAQTNFANSAAAATEGEAVMLTADDQQRVFGTYYEAQHPKAIILLFHQAGSSKAEYATIGPRLADAGYSALAIDQRSGGDMYGPNQTVNAIGKSQDYLATMPDLEAALVWAQQKKLPIAIWGSSYSASLVFKLAALHPQDVKAVLAFSPGEYFADKTMVERDAAKDRMPVFIMSSPDPEEVASAKAIFEALPGTNNTRYVPQHGVHGSSTLIEQRDPQGAAANWQAVMTFLHRTLG